MGRGREGDHLLWHLDLATPCSSVPSLLWCPFSRVTRMPGLGKLLMEEKKGWAQAEVKPGLGDKHARFKSCLQLTY